MRFYLIPIALLAGSTALAGTGSGNGSGHGSGNSYTPKFARDEQPASVLLFDLCKRPEYPKSSLRNEEQGTVGGRVLKAWIVRSSGYRDLDRASEDALSSCAFRPASIDGRPVQSTMELQYVWKLQ